MTRRLATAIALTAGACAAPTPPAPVTTTAPTTSSTTTTTTAAPTTTTHTHAPRVARRRVVSEGMPGQDVTLEAIARCESGGDYQAENPTSTASGKYQVLDSTWNGYGGYERASDAPPEVQEAWAREAYARAGTAPWRASRSCWRAAA